MSVGVCWLCYRFCIKRKFDFVVVSAGLITFLNSVLGFCIHLWVYKYPCIFG